MLHGTVRDNLLIADPDANDDELWGVLEHANIADEIACLPKGSTPPCLNAAAASPVGNVNDWRWLAHFCRVRNSS